jgi:hypothetical protein
MGVHRFHAPALNRFFPYCRPRFESGASGKAFNRKLQVKSQNNKNRTSSRRLVRGSRMF